MAATQKNSTKKSWDRVKLVRGSPICEKLQLQIVQWLHNNVKLQSLWIYHHLHYIIKDSEMLDVVDLPGPKNALH